MYSQVFHLDRLHGGRASSFYGCEVFLSMGNFSLFDHRHYAAEHCMFNDSAHYSCDLREPALNPFLFFQPERSSSQVPPYNLCSQHMISMRAGGKHAIHVLEEVCVEGGCYYTCNCFY